MAWTTTDIERLEAAIASGVLKVRYSDGREVTYNTTAELMSALSIVRRTVNGSTGAVRVMATSKGFG